MKMVSFLSVSGQHQQHAIHRNAILVSQTALPKLVSFSDSQNAEKSPFAHAKTPRGQGINKQLGYWESPPCIMRVNVFFPQNTVHVTRYFTSNLQVKPSKHSKIWTWICPLHYRMFVLCNDAHYFLCDLLEAWWVWTHPWRLSVQDPGQVHIKIKRKKQLMKQQTKKL